MKTKVYPSIRLLDGTKEEPYYIDMFYQEDMDDNVPVITFISEENKEVGDLDDFGVSGTQLVKNALNNLKSVELNWPKPSAENEYIILIENQKYASEKILDKDFLKSAATELQAEKILVGIPVRDSLLICDAHNEGSVEAFKQKLVQLFNDFSRHQTSSLIFLINDGIIESTQTVPIEHVDAKFSQNFPSSYEEQVSKMKIFGALYNVKMLLSAADIEDFQSGMFISICNAISENINKENFNKTIEIQAEHNKPEKNKTNSVIIEKFFERLPDNPQIRSLIKRANDPIKIAFIFGVDFRNGDVHQKIITYLPNQNK